MDTPTTDAAGPIEQPFDQQPGAAGPGLGELIGEARGVLDAMTIEARRNRWMQLVAAGIRAGHPVDKAVGMADHVATEAAKR